MVVFRLLQGVFGAALVPLSQATHAGHLPVGEARLGHGDLGHGRDGGADPGADAGRLPDRCYNWRWVFYVNLPFGINRHRRPAGVHAEGRRRMPDMRFDWTGFAVLALGIGAMQMMLDRGQDQDWFDSREIIIEAVLAGLGFYCSSSIC